MSWSLWEVRCVLTSWWWSKLFSLKNFKEVASLAFRFIPFGGSCFAFTLEKIIFHASVSPSYLERMSQTVYLLVVSYFLFSNFFFIHVILLPWSKTFTLLGTWIKNQRGNKGQKRAGILVKLKYPGQIIWKHNRKSQQFYVSTYDKVLLAMKVGETRYKDE